MEKRVAIISLRYHPAYIQHLIAYAKMLREMGCIPILILHRTYGDPAELSNVGEVRFMDDPAVASKYLCAIMVNASLQNKELMLKLKSLQVKILYLYHEPWNLSLGYLRNEGVLNSIRGALAHRAIVPVLKLADRVILESEYGLNAYRTHDIRYNTRCSYFPQIFDDELNQSTNQGATGKRYFGYIGNVCRAHSFDQFLAFMRTSLAAECNIDFLIATRNRLPDAVLSDPILQRSPEKVVLRSGRPLASSEINDCYARCYCVWNLYRRSTQSGVLPKALMFGTPVIASQIGSFPEHVVEGESGRLLPEYDFNRIMTALKDFRSRASIYHNHCRAQFLRTFHYRSQIETFHKILYEMDSDKSLPVSTSKKAVL